MLGSRPLSAHLHKQLLAYAAGSEPAREAVYRIAQCALLLPVFFGNTYNVDGPLGITEARRCWGKVADLLSAITGNAASEQLVIDAGFGDVRGVGGIVEFGGDFALGNGRLCAKPEFTVHNMANPLAMLVAAHQHESHMKAWAAGFQEELCCYDLEVVGAALEANQALASFGDLAAMLDPFPADFPLWDGRPMFLAEQLAFLDYLTKLAGAAVVVANLVDEQLGMLLLHRSEVVVNAADRPCFDVGRLPARLLDKTVPVVARQVGTVVLQMLDRLTYNGAPSPVWLGVIAIDVQQRTGIDISAAWADAYRRPVVDLRTRPEVYETGVAPYEFPELS